MQSLSPIGQVVPSEISELSSLRAGSDCTFRKGKAVVVAVSAPGVGDVTTETLDDTGVARLEVSDGVEVSLTGLVVRSSGPEVDEVVDLVPEVDLRHHHFARGDWHPLVCLAVDDVDVLVALRAKDQGEAAAILGVHWRLIHLHPS